MSNDQTEADKEFHLLATELSSEYGELFAEAVAGNFNSPEYKARKKALRVKEQELKRRLKDAKKAAREAK